MNQMAPNVSHPLAETLQDLERLRDEIMALGNRARVEELEIVQPPRTDGEPRRRVCLGRLNRGGVLDGLAQDVLARVNALIEETRAAMAAQGLPPSA